MSETLVAPPTTPPASTRHRQERVRSTSERHWLGLHADPEQKAFIDEIRTQYLVTASEYYRAATSVYDNLRAQSQSASPHRPAFSLVNRNVQLFLAYSVLWEAFNHIYTAASYTEFARHGPERAPLEDERAQIERVLRSPVLTDSDLTGITLLKNGETVQGATTRMISRGSRELKDLYGRAHDQTLTNMDAFLQGVVEVEETQTAEGAWQTVAQREHWAVQALDDSGEPIDPDSPFSAQKYRSVIRCHCYQIRSNVNFVGKSEGSIDDAILIMRAFCLLDPVVEILLQDQRKDLIFAL